MILAATGRLGGDLYFDGVCFLNGGSKMNSPRKEVALRQFLTTEESP